MILKEFTPEIYPRTLWVAIPQNDDDLEYLAKQFTHYLMTPGMDEEVPYNQVIDRLLQNTGTSIAECRPVWHKKQNKYGILCIVHMPSELDSSVVAHESVHIADYFFLQLGMCSEDFTDGDEPFAYMVGWAAGCIAKTKECYIKQNKK